jgi:hypothetical protein
VARNDSALVRAWAETLVLVLVHHGGTLLLNGWNRRELRDCGLGGRELSLALDVLLEEGRVEATPTTSGVRLRLVNNGGGAHGDLHRGH